MEKRGQKYAGGGFQHLHKGIQHKGIRLWVWLIAALVALPDVSAALDRRKDQFPSEPGYMFLPLPYSIPGLGQGFFFIGYGSNLFGTYADGYLAVITGDADGKLAGLNEIHLWPKTLLLEIYGEDISRATVNQYTKRGMSSGKKDYQVFEVNKANSRYGNLTLTLFDRMFELSHFEQRQDVALTRILDPEGNELQKIDPPAEISFKSSQSKIQLDYTDDYYDPRVGVRLWAAQSYSPRQTANEPSYYVLDKSITGYIPVGAYSTWLFNLFASDAVVTEKGETDPARLAVLNPANCPPADPTCQNAIAANTYGTATSLGGRERLQAYPRQRFVGAHSRYFGTEFRLNLTEEFTPFDYFIWKDVRTGVQVAFFYEQGSVADKPAEIGKHPRSSTGIGLRMVTASGAVYRADLAGGDEGILPTIIVNYPY
ncbi:MAG: hypothetical protein OEW12_02170 [Deltaproteobacteria bacterium]|nr:hypothetical protein [Deltaproteobacteria bacterium]